MLNKKIALALVVCFSIVGSLVAQNRTFSPYSRYGLGDIQGTSIGRLQGMGGVGVAQRSAYTLNDVNPASLTAIDSLSFMFEAGVGFFSQKIQASDITSSAQNMNFDLFAFGFPISRWAGMSLGVRPFAGTGYNIASTSGTYPDRVTTTNKGEGNITDAFLSFGFRPAKNWSLGVTASYLFGAEKHYSYNFFADDPYALQTGTLREVSVNDFKIDFGAQYTMQLSEGRRFIFGGTFRPQGPITGDVSTHTESGTVIDYSENKLYEDGVVLEDTTTSLSYFSSRLPFQLGLGATYEIADKLSTSIDYTFANWSNTPFYDKTTTTVDLHNLAVGAEFIPNDLKTGQLFNRMRYRVGGYYKKEYLKFDSYQLTDYGITFGAGIPLRRSKNSLNFGFAYGVRGKSSDGLLKENYFRINLNVSLHEFWFVKRKFE